MENGISGRAVYRACSIVALLAALLEPRWSAHSFAWIAVSILLWVAAERFKDVEKIKAKVQAETTTALELKYADDAKAAIDGYYMRMNALVSSTVETALKQVAVYIRDSSPTRGRGG